MSRGSKVVLNYAPQTNKDVPKTGWKNLPYTSNSLSVSFENKESETITDSRITQAGLPTSGQVQGDITIELAKDYYNEWLAAAAFNEWQGNVLTFGGDVAKQFAVEVAYKDVGVYHLYAGLLVNKLKLSIEEDSYAMLTLGLIGKDYKNQNDTAFSKTPTPSGTLERVSSLSVEDIKIDGVTTKGVACATRFEFELDNTIQANKCLGDGLFAGNLSEMMANMTGNLTLVYGKKAQEFVNKQMTGATVSIEVTLKFRDNSKLVLLIPKAQVKGEAANGGKNEIIKQQLNYTVVEQAPTLTKTPA